MTVIDNFFLDEVYNFARWDFRDVDWGEDHMQVVYQAYEKQYPNIKILQLDKNAEVRVIWANLQSQLQLHLKGEDLRDKIFIPLVLEQKHENVTLLQFGMISIFRNERQVVTYIPILSSLRSGEITVQELRDSLRHVAYRIKGMVAEIIPPPYQWKILQITPDPHLQSPCIGNTSFISLSDIAIVMNQIFEQKNGRVKSSWFSSRALVEPIERDYLSLYETCNNLSKNLRKTYAEKYRVDATFDILQEKKMVTTLLDNALQASLQADAELKNKQELKDEELGAISKRLNEATEELATLSVLYLDKLWENKRCLSNAEHEEIQMKKIGVKDLDTEHKDAQDKWDEDIKEVQVKRTDAQHTLKDAEDRSELLRQIHACLLAKNWFKTITEPFSIEDIKTMMSGLLAVILMKAAGMEGVASEEVEENLEFVRRRRGLSCVW